MVKGTKALEVWCQRITASYPGVEVCNMTTAWRDGLAFCAIIHHYNPDLFDFHTLDRRNIHSNCAMAFKLAEEHFGIPQLLDPKDMVECSTPDRLSILTYVSEIYHKLKHLQPGVKASSSPSTTTSPSTAATTAPQAIPSTATTRKLVRQNSTDSAGMPLSRTPSSSGVSSTHSNSSSCPSSASSICDSPPPLNKISEETKSNVDDHSNNKTTEEEKKPEEVKSNADEPVILRKRDRSSKLASRRMVQSMFLESTGGISSLINLSNDKSPPSPDIERENPFRETMMKFASMEKSQVKVATHTKTLSCSKSTETLMPKQDTKSTQTLSILRPKTSAPFRTVLNTTNINSSKGMPKSKSILNCSKLSYTPSPRPYSQGQINRSLSLGQSLNKMAITSQSELVQRSLSTSTSSTTISHSSPSHHRPEWRTHQRRPSMSLTQYNTYNYAQATPPGLYVRQQPLIWHSSPYTSSPSPYSTPMESPNNSSYYSAHSTLLQQSLTFNRPPSNVYDSNDSRLKLHMEGQSSLV